MLKWLNKYVIQLVFPFLMNSDTHLFYCEVLASGHKVVNECWVIWCCDNLVFTCSLAPTVRELILDYLTTVCRRPDHAFSEHTCTFGDILWHVVFRSSKEKRTFLYGCTESSDNKICMQH